MRDSRPRRSTRSANQGWSPVAPNPSGGPDPYNSPPDPSPTVASYFGAFTPTPDWADLSAWPPDVFALSNLVLDHTEAYRFAIAPPAPRRWPPHAEWNREVVAAARAWRDTAARPNRDAPPAVRRLWNVLQRDRDVRLSVLRSGDKPDVWEALLTLHAMADETCAGLASSATATEADTFERRAWDLFLRHRSLASISPERVRVTPKANFAPRGISIRSLSRYLALNYESVGLSWRRIEDGAWTTIGQLDRGTFSMVLVPWPLRIEARAFRPVDGPPINMDRTAYGFFEFDPASQLDFDRLGRLLDSALRRTGQIDAVVLPEASVAADEIPALEQVIEQRGGTLLVAGVRGPIDARGVGRNYVHIAVRSQRGWLCYEQAKHHRWSLDDGQIRQYRLGRSLAPARHWWEAIDLPPRTVEIVDLGGGTTVAPLICEDLARLDEVADMLRRIGPSLVIALLLDGPQLPQRWSQRYAAVLADEPGSAVLTLTAYGMVARSRPPGKRASRAVALWGDPSSGTRQLDLGRGAAGLLLNTTVRRKTVWTADGRRHGQSTPAIELAGVEQLVVPE